MRGHKYGAVATTVDNIRFHSKAEARRYSELKLLEKAGQIRGLVCQPKFPLSAKVHDAPVSVIVGHYVADFEYERLEIDEGGFSGRMRRVIEDVKGMKTPLYRWKKKHFEAQYGLLISEIGSR